MNINATEQNEHPHLKLCATTAEEVKVLSAHVQDAIIMQSFMMHYKDEQCFRMLINRFCWEIESLPEEAHRRIHSVLAFSHITKVQAKGFQPESVSKIHKLLMIEAQDNIIHLYFSGGYEMKFECEKILCHLRDIDQHWYSNNIPNHENK